MCVCVWYIIASSGYNGLLHNKYMKIWIKILTLHLKKRPMIVEITFRKKNWDNVYTLIECLGWSCEDRKKFTKKN